MNSVGFRLITATVDDESYMVLGMWRLPDPFQKEECTWPGVLQALQSRLQLRFHTSEFLEEV